MSTFSQNLYNMRVERGYTLESFAKAINESKGTNFTKGTISKWEHGKTAPSFQSIVPIADFFNVSVDSLLGIEIERIDNANSSERLQEYFKRISAIGNKHSREQIDEAMDKAIDLYELYQKSSPEVRSAVELLLKSAQQKP